MRYKGAQWYMRAGVMADMAGRRQTVPRAGFTAFASAIEETTDHIIFVTDHAPLPRASRKGRAQCLGKGKAADI